MALARWDALLEELYAGPRQGVRCVANPYRDEAPQLDLPGAAAQRRLNLEHYLGRVGSPRWVLLGEAMGYRGARFSGIPFTCERQFVVGTDRYLAWTSGHCAPTSRNRKLWLEPSASVVWAALRGAPDGILLWNTFPWHPHRPGDRLSNRRPESGLVDDHLSVLAALLARIHGARLLAVGKTAACALEKLGVSAPVLRHPAYGGATLFRQQLAAVWGNRPSPAR